jgi:3-ketosteroid 9alpha-monooxygenase subunit A
MMKRKSLENVESIEERAKMHRLRLQTVATESKMQRGAFGEGWFAVAFSHELPAGTVKALRYFSQELVAFRTGSGHLAVFDAYCPHLGAHLGHGGVVVGETIRCPFHGWCYGLDGNCQSIPGVEKIPPAAHVHRWLVEERNGLVFVFNSPQGRPPTYHIPEIAEYGTAGWLDWQQPSTWRVRALPADIVENAADLAHFETLHSMRFDSSETVFETEGHTATVRTVGMVAPPMFPREERIESVSTYYGPAYEITQYGGARPNYILVAHTPVDSDYLDLRFAMFCREAEKRDSYVEDVCASLAKGLRDDAGIWEHKVYLDRPVLSAADQQITRVRAWYSQFFR